MSRKTSALAGIAVAAVLFVAINILSGVSLERARIDLTENGLFTLSPGTRTILNQLDEPISLRLFFSEKLAAELPAFRVYGARVRELLEEYVHHANGKLRLEVIDPVPFSDAEDRAVQAGIQGVPLDQASGEQVYFGLEGTNAVDLRETIPFFQQNRESFLEYDLSKLVYALSHPDKPKVGLLGDVPFEYGAGGPMAAMRGQSEPYVVYDQLRQLFEIKTLERDIDRIGDDISILLIARPKGLSERTQYAIDQFILRGGRAMVFVDPWAESAAAQPGPGGMPPTPGASQEATLDRLLAAWGVEMVADRFVADPNLAMRVAHGEGARRRAVPYMAWLALTPEQFDRTDVVTADLNALNLASAGALRKRAGGAGPGAGAGTDVTFTPLVSTSQLGQLMAIDDIRWKPDPDKLMGAARPSGEVQVLAARVTGRFKTAFPDGPPAGDPAKGGEAGPGGSEAASGSGPAQLKESVQPASLIIVADSDLLEDRFWVQSQDFFGRRLVVPIASNGDLVTNGIDNLAGSSELIGLRSRAGSTRPFTVFDDLKRDAAQQFMAREKELRRRLEDTERQITELQGKAKDSAGGALLSAEEQKAIDGFRGEVVRIRKQLRNVQHQLNQDIESLSAAIKLVNIGLVPLLVAVAAVGLAAVRVRRRQARRLAREG